MTENQWQQGAGPSLAKVDAVKADTVKEDAGKTDVARGEAAGVAGQAAASARNVAATAKEEAAGVALEAKASTRDLMNQAKSDFASQAGAQQQKAAEGIHAISAQLRGMADAPEQHGVASDLVRQAADRSASLAAWLENRDPGALLAEAKSFARRRPGAFLLLAAGAGLVAGRLGRSLQAGAPTSTSSNVAALPRQTQPLAPTSPRHLETVIAAGTGDHFFEVPAARHATDSGEI
jgi:hypothetical protein